MEAAGIMPPHEHGNQPDKDRGPHEHFDSPAPPRDLKESGEIRHLIANLLNATLLDTAETYRRLEWVKARVKHLENVLSRPDGPVPKRP